MEFNFKPVKKTKRYLGEKYKSLKHNNGLKRIDYIHPVFAEIIGEKDANSFFEPGNYSHEFNEYKCFNEKAAFKEKFFTTKRWDNFSFDFDSGVFKPFKHDLYSTINLKAKKDTSSIQNIKLPKIKFVLYMRAEKGKEVDMRDWKEAYFNDAELMPYVKYFNMGKV